MDWEVAGKDNGTGGGASPMRPKRKGRKMKKWAIALLVIVVAVAFLKIQSCVKNQPKNLNWPTTGLATMLPDPPTKKGEVNYDYDDSFSADVAECSEDQYKAYIESCKDKGFTTDAKSASSSFEAYTGEGYKLSLSYYSYSKQISISLKAPTEMGTLTWPTTGAGSNAPVPTSTKGKIESDSSTWFSASVGDTDAAAYNAYVDACIAAGYSVDYHKGETTFYADRADGAHISLSYPGFNIMKVTVDLKKVSGDSSESAPAADATASEAPAATEETPAATDSSTSGSSDLRQFTDEYEAFMNSYCDFMEKYNSSSDAVGMVVDYAKWTKDYADWADRVDSYDFSNASAEDVAYYTAAVARISDRVSKLGQ